MVEYIYDKMIEWNMYLVLQLINIIDNSFLNGFVSFIFRMARAVKGLCTICIATHARDSRICKYNCTGSIRELFHPG